MMSSRAKILTAVAAAGVVIVDQLTKAWALEVLLGGNTISIIDGFLALRLGFNYGLAFGILGHVPEAWRGVVAFLPVIAFLILLRLMRDGLAHGGPSVITLGLVLGGAVGNLVDRVRIGAVVDFVDLYWRGLHWPAFNVADSAITIGVGVLAASMIRSDSGNAKAPSGDA